MEIEEAYNIAVKDPRVKSLMKDGFYLSSALLKQTHLHSADSWILIFFNPDTGKVFSVTVDKDGVSLSDVQEPLKAGNYGEMSLEGRGNVQEILDLISDQFSGQISQVLISAKPESWEALVIGTNLNTLYLVIDPISRKIIKKEKGSMLG